jgi:hypothetical protein
MDEFKIIFWIIIALVYLFTRKKKKPAPPTPARPASPSDEYETTSPGKPVTFEDLLREIEGSKRVEKPLPEPAYEEPAKPAWQPYNYDEEIVGEKKPKPVEDTNYDYRKHDKIYDVYDDAIKYAFVKPSLEETMKIEDTVVRFNQFKGYQTETKSRFREDLLKELKDPKGFKKAFIMSEILNRKF